MDKLIIGGLGISRGDVSLKLKKTTEEVDKIYCELYTSQIPGVDLSYLENLFDRNIEKIKRSNLEENFESILNNDYKSVLIMVPGDPLVFTTHLSMIIEAKDKDISTEVIHAPSIYSAIGETGLFLYNFGKATTVPFLEEGYKPESPYDTIKMNKGNDLHTLVLLDIKDEEGRYMDPTKGLGYLIELEDKRDEGVISKDDKVVAVSQLGTDSVIEYDKIKVLKGGKFNTPAALVFPGKLNDVEEEYLETFR